VAVLRRCAKVLLVDEHGRVLLFSGIDRTKPDTPPWWFAAGGGLDADESMEEAAIREVHEETGLSISDPGPVLLTRRFEWEFEGEIYDQEEAYFLVHTESFAPVRDGWTETELATMREHRWWTIDELRATDEVIYPEGLADLVERFVS
jgi:8-oxo-dGTP pyrophosphatase MutT (NUDIX family)